MKSEKRLWIWGTLIVSFFLLLYLLKAILFPFIVGIIIAYFLDPLADRLERFFSSRVIASLLSLLAFFIIALLACLTLFPVLHSQITHLSEKIPLYLQSFFQWIEPQIILFQERFASQENQNVKDMFSSYIGDAFSIITKFIGSVLTNSLAIFNIFSLLFLTPIISFYLLKDWDRMVAFINEYLPKKKASHIRAIFREIDQTLSSFFRGQGLTCLILAIYYAVTLSMVGLEFGLLIGLFIGFISFVPYVGLLIGAILSIGLALIQFSEFLPILLVGSIFVIGQILEAYVLIPKLVGKSVGLNEVWVLFALLAGGSLFGFIGIFLAVPIASVIRVVLKFTLNQYKQSALYLN